MLGMAGRVWKATFTIFSPKEGRSLSEASHRPAGGWKLTGPHKEDPRFREFLLRIIGLNRR